MILCKYNYHNEDSLSLLERGWGVGAVNPPVSQPVKDEAQEPPGGENGGQTDQTLAEMLPVAPDLHTTSLTSAHSTRNEAPIFTSAEILM